MSSAEMASGKSNDRPLLILKPANLINLRVRVQAVAMVSEDAGLQLKLAKIA